MEGDDMGRKTTGRLFLRNGVYWIDYTHNGERIRHSLGTGSKITADKKLNSIIRPYTAEQETERRREAFNTLKTAEEVAREAKRDRDGRLTVAGAWPAYEKDKTRPQSGPHTMKDYRRHWERFAAWIEGQYQIPLQLEQVTGDMAGEHMTYLEGLGLGPNRYNKARQALSLIFRTLSRRCGDMPDPFRDIKQKSLDPKTHRKLSIDELRKICSTADGELRTILALGMFTGIRIADACLIEWGEIELAGNRIVRIMSKTRSRKRKPVIIPLHPSLRTILEETPISRRNGPVNPEFARLYRLDTGATVSKRIRDHFDACGIRDINTRKALRERKKDGIDIGRLRAPALASYHSLRHSFVSLLADSGVPLATARELVGHGSESIQRVYLHGDEAGARKAINLLPALNEAPEDDKRDRAALLAEIDTITKGANDAALRRMIEAERG